MGRIVVIRIRFCLGDIEIDFEFYFFFIVKDEEYVFRLLCNVWHSGSLDG